MIKKAELHCHLEGSITPSMAKKLAAKHCVKLDPALLDANGDYQFNSFAEFLTCYDLASHVIRTEGDYYAITYDYLQRQAAVDVIYQELTASPDHALMNELSYEAMLAGITAAIDDAYHDFGIVTKILIVFVRHLGLARAEHTLDQLLKYPHPHVTGVSLAGDEVNFPANLFQAVFERAASHGLGCTAHAGEVMGPASVWDAINTLPLTRIGHGVRAIEDPQLIEALIAGNYTLEVCPGSNIALKVYANLDAHPLRQLMDHGLKLTLSSDDPPFFHTDIAQEYHIARAHFNFTDDELLQMTRNSIQAGFISPEDKAQLLQRLQT